MAFSDRELIARLVQCEAGGEGENRNESSCNSNYEQGKQQYTENMRVFLKEEVYETQFFKQANLTVQYNSQNIYNMVPTDEHYNIADWAIAGNKINEIGECLWYMNPYNPSCPNTFPYNGSRHISYKDK